MPFGPLFHFANLLVGAGFLVPYGFFNSDILLRAFLSSGHLCLLIWSYNSVCSGENFLFQLSFFSIHLVYLILLTRKHLPVFIPKHLQDTYYKLFAPLKVTKKEFCQLVENAAVLRIPSGKYFSIENETRIHSKLHLLMSGTMLAQSDGIFLHKITSNEFVDSVEWKAKQVDPLCRKFQVTIQATEDCQVLVLEDQHLEKICESLLKLEIIIDCLVGKDITRKLYQTSDLANIIIHQSQAGNKGKVPTTKDFKNPNSRTFRKLLNFHRTLSSDAIHTGCKGMVRSRAWMNEADLKTMDQEGVNNQVMVINFELDIPPTLHCLSHRAPVHTLDKEVLAEAQFIAQQRKYWPSGFI